jgi:hypothetical protein
LPEIRSAELTAEAFTELVLRLFAAFTLSRTRSFALLRMTACEGLRVTVEGFRMTSLCSVILSGAKNLYSFCLSHPHPGRVGVPALTFPYKRLAGNMEILKALQLREEEGKQPVFSRFEEVVFNERRGQVIFRF